MIKDADGGSGSDDGTSDDGTSGTSGSSTDTTSDQSSTSTSTSSSSSSSYTREVKRRALDRLSGSDDGDATDSSSSSEPSGGGTDSTSPRRETEREAVEQQRDSTASEAAEETAESRDQTTPTGSDNPFNEEVESGGGSRPQKENRNQKRNSAGAGGFVSSARDKVGDVVESGKEAAGEAVDTAKERAGDVKDAAVDRARDVPENVREEAIRRQQAGQQTADGAFSRTVGATEEKAQDAAGAVDNAADQTGEAIEDTGETAGDVYQYFDERGPAELAVDAGDWAAGPAGDRAMEYAENAETDPDVTEDLTRGGVLSESPQDTSGVIPGEVGGTDVSEARLRRSAGKIDSFKQSFDKNPDVTVAGSDAPERVLQGAAGAGVDLLNVPSHVLLAETAVEAGANAPGAVQEHGGREVAETATGVGYAVGSAMAQEASDKPIEFTAGLGMDIATGAALGSAAKKGYVQTRGKVATRDIPDERTVEFNEIQRSDVASGQSRLTRHSESAVGSDAKHAMPDEDFPVEPASDPQTELQRLSESHTTPEIESALDVDEGENVLYHATGRTKGDTYEARSYRDYDPDAMYFSGSVSKNFLPDAGNPEISPLDVSLRRPKPVKAVRSLFSDENPTIVASAGKIDTMPDDATSRGDVSQFLKENTNNNRFYVQDPDSGRQTGEAEALVGAHAGRKENPDPGAGIIEEGEGTEFVNLNEPLQTEIRGEPVRIQAMRQRGYREGGETTLPDAGESYSPDELADSLESRGSPGGEAGTPVVPTFGLGGGPAAGGPQGVDETGLSTRSPTPSAPQSSPGPSGGATRGLGDAYALDVDDSGFGSGTRRSPDGPDRSSTPDRSDPGSSPPTGGSGFGSGPESSPGGPFDESGPGSGAYPTGPTVPPSGDGSGGGGGSGSPPPSPPGGGPGYPPGPTETPPPSGGPGTPPGPSYTPSPNPGPSPGPGPNPLFNPTESTPRPRGEDNSRDRDDRGERELGVYDIPFQNPIASGTQVLGFSMGSGSSLPFDETGDGGQR